MEIRDAVERDAAAMADLTDAPESVLRRLVHDRSVRVLVDGGGATTDTPSDATEQTLQGFVSFDAHADAVHVTEFGGDREACESLLAEPLRFAEREGFAVEMLLRDEDEGMRAAAEAVGFTPAGDGPRFRGEPTRRYRFESA
ncbi:MAG: hypothetical protein ACOCQU_05845 [Halolamina sp.]